MPYLIGTDEAGYGPNLGPLVVSASVWEVPEGVDGVELYERLQDVVVPSLGRLDGRRATCVAVADSKALYKPGKGLRELERGLWAAWNLLGRRPKSWADVWDAAAPGASEAMRHLPWYAGYDAPIPLDADAEQLPSLARAIESGLAAADVQLLELCSRVVFADEFNRLLDIHDSKGTALSHVTLDLVARCAGRLPDGDVLVLCDKHGGRNRYGPLLAEHFPDWLVEVHEEGRTRSLYRFGPIERRMEIGFQAKGETSLPTALASMASKYLRELAMRAFNAFWRDRLPGLRPTAGYPQDARRFKADIGEAQLELDVDDDLLWRRK